MLKLWNIVLITLAFEFTLLGTFITRSGVISSVHSFAQSDIGGYFLGFIGFSRRWRRLPDLLPVERPEEPESPRVDSFPRKRVPP